MDLKRKTKIWKKTWLPVLLTSLLFSMTHCFFGPVDLFFPNSMNFNTDLGTVLPVFLVYFGIGFVVLEILMTAAVLLPKKIYLACIGALFALALASWIQGNLLNTGMDLLEGGEPDWGPQRGSMILSAALWIALVVLFVIAAVKKGTLTMKVITCAAALLLVMEAGSLAVSWYRFSNTPSAADDLSDHPKTNVKDVLTYSDQGDILLFVVDSLDTRLADQMLEENREYVDFMPGAVYYRNTSTCYNRTNPSLVNILTTKITRNEQPFLAFCDESFSETPLFPELRKKGYTIDIYGETDNMFSASLAGTIDNLAVDHYRLTDISRFMKAYIRLVEFRYAPAIMKPFFYTNFVDFINMAFTDPNAKYGKSYKSNVLYYNACKEKGITVVQDKKYFKLYHTDGAHTPFRLDRNGTVHDDGEIEMYEACLGGMLVVRNIVDELKAKGAYDNATILIFGDHGIREGNQVNNPAMIVKLPHADGEMTTSMAPVQLLDVPATVLAAAGADPALMGTPLWGWEGTAHRDRVMYTYTWTKMTSKDYYLDTLTEFAVPDDATKLDEYVATGNVY